MHWDSSRAIKKKSRQRKWALAPFTRSWLGKKSENPQGYGSLPKPDIEVNHLWGSPSTLSLIAIFLLLSLSSDQKKTRMTPSQTWKQMLGLQRRFLYLPTYLRTYCEISSILLALHKRTKAWLLLLREDKCQPVTTRHMRKEIILAFTGWYLRKAPSFLTSGVELSLRPRAKSDSQSLHLHLVQKRGWSSYKPPKPRCWLLNAIATSVEHKTKIRSLPGIPRFESNAELENIYSIMIAWNIPWFVCKRLLVFHTHDCMLSQLTLLYPSRLRI